MFEQLVNFLPLIRGTLQKNVNLGNKSWFGVGGSAEVLFMPIDMDDLVYFLRNIPDNINITILGAMSNTLIRSGGVKGIVVILGAQFKKIYVTNDVFEVGAGVSCSQLSAFAADSEIGGLEFLAGLPGTMGGALKMNAGCYGSEISDILIEFEAVTKTGNVQWFTKKDICFEYRASNISDDIIITRAWFKGNSNVDYSIIRKTHALVKKKKETQPINKRSCGSTFKNPIGQKAWKLIEDAGCKGMRIGGARVSEQHCNFIINENNATAEDIENLGEKIVKKVYDKSGIMLEWEIIRLGEK